MALRNEMIFTVSRLTLIDACRKRIEEHQERIAEETEECESIRDNLAGTSGFEIREYVGTGGIVQLQPVFLGLTDLNRYNELQSKIKGHRETVDQFSRYLAAFLASQDPPKFDLDKEDIDFFGVE